MPGLQDLTAATKPMTGPTSVEAAIAALNPQDVVALAQGIDPLADGSVIAPGQVPSAPSNSSLSPEMKAMLGARLQEMLQMLGTPQNEADAAFSTSIQNALMSLGGGV